MIRYKIYTYFYNCNSSLSHQLSEVQTREQIIFTETAGCTEPTRSKIATTSLTGASKLATASFPILNTSSAGICAKLGQDAQQRG